MKPIFYLMIPCYNEAQTLRATLAELPQVVNGLDINLLVVDDGSSDDSAKIAEACGAEVLHLPHQGLARAYKGGMQAAYRRGADYIVTLDADGQYDPKAIKEILDLLQSNADVVLVERGDTFYNRMNWKRRLGHIFGRYAVRIITGLNITDPVTGYRGYTRKAAWLLDIQSSYTYTLETLVQIPFLGLQCATLTVAPRVTTRPSRLFRSPLVYMYKQAKTLVWSSWVYKFAKQPLVKNLRLDHFLQRPLDLS